MNNGCPFSLQASSAAAAGDSRLSGWWFGGSRWKWWYRDGGRPRSSHGNARISTSRCSGAALFTVFAVTFSHRQTVPAQMLLEVFLDCTDPPRCCAHSDAGLLRQ